MAERLIFGIASGKLHSTLAAFELASTFLSASAKLADGLGLKGVLPCAGWAGLTDTPRGISSGEGPPLPQKLAGFDVEQF